MKAVITKIMAGTEIPINRDRWTLKSINQFVVDQGDLDVTVIRNPTGDGGYWVRYHRYAFDHVAHVHTLQQAYYYILGMINHYNHG